DPPGQGARPRTPRSRTPSANRCWRRSKSKGQRWRPRAPSGRGRGPALSTRRPPAGRSRGRSRRRKRAGRTAPAARSRDTLDGGPRQRYHAPVMLKVGLVGLFLFAAAPAYADGAFPDEMQIFLPADQPHRIIVTTTFGILESNDDGASWQWI